MKKSAKSDFLKEVFLRDGNKLSPRRIDRAVEALGTSPEPPESPRTALNRFYDNLNVSRHESPSKGQNKASGPKLVPAWALSLGGGLLVLFLCIGIPFSKLGRKSKSELPQPEAEQHSIAQNYDWFMSAEEKAPGGTDEFAKVNSLYYGSFGSSSDWKNAPGDSEIIARANALIREILAAYPLSWSSGDGPFCISVYVEEGDRTYEMRFSDEVEARASEEPLAKLWKLFNP